LHTIQYIIYNNHSYLFAHECNNYINIYLIKMWWIIPTRNNTKLNKKQQWNTIIIKLIHQFTHLKNIKDNVLYSCKFDDRNHTN